MAMTRDNRWLALFGLLLCIVAVGGLLLLTTQQIASQHALARHGQDAVRATEYIQSLGEQADYCRWRCGDGRDRYLCAMPGGEWAVVVMDGVVQVTAFVTGNQDYVVAARDGCTNPWHYSHP